MTHEVRIAAIRVVAGEQAVLGGASAAWVHGVCWASPGDPVEIVLPDTQRVRHRQELRVRCDTLFEDEIVMTTHGRATSPARTAFDLARRGWPDRGLAWVDALMRETGLSRCAVEVIDQRHPGLRGVKRGRIVTARADPRSESPRESMLRWMLLEAGLPVPVPQYVVLDHAGCFVARLDLAWPSRRIAIEYDGEHHRGAERLSNDLQRHNELRSLGWVVLQVDAESFRRPEQFLGPLNQMLSSSSRA